MHTSHHRTYKVHTAHTVHTDITVHTENHSSHNFAKDRKIFVCFQIWALYPPPKVFVKEFEK